jgi:hypothetical protein
MEEIGIYFSASKECLVEYKIMIHAHNLVLIDYLACLDSDFLS